MNHPPTPPSVAAAPAAAAIRMLIVDDEPSVLAALQRALRQSFGGQLLCEVYSDALAALSRCREQAFEIVIADLQMPDIDGVKLLSFIAAMQPHGVRLMLTGAIDFAAAQRAINDAGVFRYLCKPWDERELVAHVQAAMHEAQRRLEASAAEPAAAADRAASERQRLEALEPGITHVEWGPDGEVLLDPLLSR